MFLHIINRVGLKFPWLRNHLPGRLINNKNTSPSIKYFFIVWCFMFTNIWTGMASNNTISWSATNDSTVQYQPLSAVNTALHRRFISTPRWAMSIFLLKSDGGTPQNMRFNVFIKRACSIYGENKIWHATSWRFTPGSWSGFPNCAVPRREFGLAYLG